MSLDRQKKLNISRYHVRLRREAENEADREQRLSTTKIKFRGTPSGRIT